MTEMIFIVGNSRSGTTMLSRIFGNHSKVYTFGELHFFENQVEAKDIYTSPIWEEKKCISLLNRLITTARDGFFQSPIPGHYSSDITEILSTSNFRDPISVYSAFLQYETKLNKKSIPCEQTPRYLFFSSEILNKFPKAKVINIVRDPRDVLLSQKHKWRRKFLGAKNIPILESIRAWVNYHPYTISLLWLGALRKAEEMETHPRFTTIRFEDLLNKPETTVRSLCEFTDLAFESEMLNVPQIGSSTGNDTLLKGINSRHAGKWRNSDLSPTEVSICQRVTNTQMRRMGYDLVKTDSPFFLRTASKLTFILKSSIALLLNLNRTKNLRETLLRRLNAK